MTNHIGSCGIVCSECPAYTATINNDDELRRQTAESWSKHLGNSFTAEDINCLGCGSETLFGYCSTCTIRDCTTSQNLQNCSECNDYSCEKLNEFFQSVPDAKKTLDSLRK